MEKVLTLLAFATNEAKELSAWIIQELKPKTIEITKEGSVKFYYDIEDKP